MVKNKKVCFTTLTIEISVWDGEITSINLSGKIGEDMDEVFVLIGNVMTTLQSRFRWYQDPEYEHSLPNMTP